MIERIRYAWGMAPPAEFFQTAPPLRAVEWRSPAIPSQAQAAAQEERVWELSGVMGQPRVGQATPVEYYEIQVDGQTIQMTVYDRLSGLAHSGDPRAQRVARFCQALAGAAFGYGRQSPNEPVWKDEGPRPEQTIGQPPRSEEAAMRDFAQTLFSASPHAWVTRLMVAANVLVFVLMGLSGVNVLFPDVESLKAWGANFGPRTLSDEPWRLITCAFLHGGLIHLGFNMYVLWDGGNLMERMVGSVGFLVLYLASAVAGSMASLWWNPHTVSVGASGAVFGVFGALLGFIVLQRDARHAPAMKRLLRTVGMFLAINLVIGATVPVIDNSAHVGGMLAGMVCGMVMSHPLTERSSFIRLVRAAAAAVVAAIGLSLGALALPAAPATLEDVAQGYDEMRVEVERDVSRILVLRQVGRISPTEAADRLEGDVLPRWAEAQERLTSLLNHPHASRRAIMAILGEMRDREEKWREWANALRAGDPEKLRRVEAAVRKIPRMNFNTE